MKNLATCEGYGAKKGRCNNLLPKITQWLCSSCWNKFNVDHPTGLEINR